MLTCVACLAVRLRRSETGGYERRGKDKNKRKSGEMSQSPEASNGSDSGNSASKKNTKRRRLTKKRPANREGSLTILYVLQSQSSTRYNANIGESQ